MADHRGSNIERSEHYGALQRIVDTLFYEEEMQVASRGAAHGERPAPASQGADGSDATCGDDVAAAASGAGTFAERFGVSAHTAVLLGLAAFDEEMGVGTAVSDEAIPEDPAEFTVRRLDVVIAAEAADLPDDLMRIVTLLPPGDYTRQRLCDQLNSAVTGHAWGQVYGTVS